MIELNIWADFIADEIIQCTGEQYGDAAQEMLEKIIRENTL